MEKIDISIKELANSIKNNNEQVLENLRLRFQNELMFNIIFFLFNNWANSQRSEFDSSLEEDDPAQRFFNAWYHETKKRVKKEMLEVNKNLTSNTFEYLNAISSNSLPSTEDYQLIYNTALSDIKKMFSKNTKPPKI
jgi:hypothetical protein